MGATLACSEATRDQGNHLVLSMTSTSVGTGDSVRLAAEVVDGGGAPTDLTVDWWLRDAHYAQILRGEWLRGLRVGQTLLVASAPGVTPESVSVNVTRHITHTTVTPDTVRLLYPGDTKTLLARSYAYIDATPSTYVWLSDDESVATVNAAGMVEAVRSGSTYVLALEATGTEDSAVVLVETPLIPAFFDPYTGVMQGLSTGVTILHTMPNTVQLTVTSSDSSIVEPAASSIPAGQTYGAVNLIPRAPGTARVHISAPGFTPTFGDITVGERRLRFRFDYTSLPIRLPASTAAIYSASFESEFDSVPVGRPTLEPFTVTLRSSDTSVFATRHFDIAVGETGAQTGIVAPLAPGTVWLVWEAPGFRADSLLFEFTP